MAKIEKKLHEGALEISVSAADTNKMINLYNIPEDDICQDITSTYLNIIGRFPAVDGSTEEELARRCRRGDETARRQMTEGNLKLVVYVARKYASCGAPLEDLIQAGNLGLLYAVDRFDSERGCRFSTFAVPCIRGAILRGIRELGPLMRLPPSARGYLGMLKSTYDDLTRELGRYPTSQEVISRAGVPDDALERLRLAGCFPFAADRLETDADVSAEAADEAMDPVAASERAELKGSIERLLSQLGGEELQVLRLLYGFDDGVCLTVTETAKICRLPAQKVKRLHDHALSRLRRSPCVNLLRAYAS